MDIIKIYLIFLYNLFMRKKTQASFKSIISAPIKSPSPDFKAANMIKSTKTPQNLQYSETHEPLHRTPTKTYYKQSYESTPKNQKSTGYKYFSQNRPSYSPQRNIDQFHSSIRSNDEVILELRRIIKMINSNQIETDSLEPENSRIRDQVKVLQIQNQRLLDLISQLQIKSETRTNEKKQFLQNEIVILRQQMNKNLQSYEKDREELYRTNQTLSSQIKSLEDRRMILEKENEGLKYLLKEKEEAERLRQSQTQRKNQQKISISMIKEQYNENLKSFQDQVTYDVNYKIKNMEEALLQAQRKVNNCENKLTLMEKVQYQNKQLLHEVESLRGQLKIEAEKNQTFLISKQLQRRENELFLMEGKYKNLMLKIAEDEKVNSLKLEEKDRYYEDKIRMKERMIEELKGNLARVERDKGSNRDLQMKAQELTHQLRQKQNYIDDLERKTQRKVAQLAQNYQMEIKILKNDLENKSSKAILFTSRQVQFEKEIAYLKEQLQNCRACQARQTESYERRIAELQHTLTALTKYMQETEDKVHQYEQLQSKLAEQNEEMDRLAEIIAQYQQSELKVNGYESMIGSLRSQIEEKKGDIIRAESQIKLQRSQEDALKESYQKQIQRLKQLHEKQLQRLRQSYEKQILRLKEQLKQVEANSQMYTKTLRLIKHDDILNQLNELKALVSESKLYKFQEEIERFSQMYQKELISSEEKVRQIERLLYEKNSLEDQLAESERMKLILEEKIRFLQNNSKIYENELKERKELCNNLIDQKSSLEKEILLMKKAKFDQESLEATKARARVISQKIQNLLELEKERQKRMSQITYQVYEMGKSSTV